MTKNYRKNKFKNHRIYDENGKKIADSKKELKRYSQLILCEKAGYIKDLQQQVRFPLLKTFKDNQGNTERGVTYIADFVYFEDKQKVVEDVKSPATKKEKYYILKRKLFKITYPEIYFKEI